MFPGHQDKSYGNLFDVVSAPDVSMNGQQLNKWLPGEFECPIHKPLFGVGKDLQLLLCGEHHMPSVLHPNICLKESCFNEVLCKLQNYITIIYQYLRGLIIGIQTLQLGFFLPESSSLWAPPVGISGDACWPLCWEVQGLVYWPLALLGHSSPPWFLPRWS